MSSNLNGITDFGQMFRRISSLQEVEMHSHFMIKSKYGYSNLVSVHLPAENVASFHT